MHYETCNLDEAAYLALQGFPFEITRTGKSSATFHFTVDDTFEEIRARFWKGDVTVQLCRWIAARTGLKSSVLKRPISPNRIESPSIVPAQQEAVTLNVQPGTVYWYWEGEGVKAAAFGSKSMHTDRFNEGNAYRNKADARSRQNPILIR